MQRNNQIKEIKKDMEIILLFFTLIALFCCICSFFMGVDLGKELQRKEDERQDKVLKEIRQKGYDVNC